MQCYHVRSRLGFSFLIDFSHFLIENTDTSPSSSSTTTRTTTATPTMSSQIILRLRLPDGSTTRHSLNESDSLDSLYTAIKAFGTIQDGFALALDPKCINVLSGDTRSIKELGIRHGEMIYVQGKMVHPDTNTDGPYQDEGLNTLAANGAPPSSSAPVPTPSPPIMPTPLTNASISKPNPTMNTNPVPSATPSSPTSNTPQQSQKPKCRHGPRGMCEHCMTKEDPKERYKKEIEKWKYKKGSSVAVMEALDALKYKIKAQVNGNIQAVSIDSKAANSFQAYLANIGFSQQRFGVLYGTIVAEQQVVPKEKEKETNIETPAAGVASPSRNPFASQKKQRPNGKENEKEMEVETRQAQVAKCEVIYEPPQQGSHEVYIPKTPEDAGDMNHRADVVAHSLGLRTLGMIFSAKPRKCILSGMDIISACELIVQLEKSMEDIALARQFVIITVALAEDGQTLFEAYQLSDQCIDMYREDAFLPLSEQKPNSGKVKLRDPAIVEGKEVTSVHTEFFLINVPIRGHESWLKTSFPVENRDVTPQQHTDLSRVLNKYKSEPFYRRISDFHLLLYLSNLLDIRTDMPGLGNIVRDQRDLNEMEEGYKLMIEAMAAQ